MLHLAERMNFNQLLRYSEPRRVVRSLTVKGPPLKIESNENSEYWAFNFKATPSTTGLRHHGYIKFFKPSSPRPLEKVDCVVDCDCFSGDTLVLMGDGTYKKIEEIRPGDTVYTHKGRIRPVIGNVERELKPNEKVFQVKTEGFPYPIISTGSHPFYLLRGHDTCRCGCGKVLPDTSKQESYNSTNLVNRQYLTGHHPPALRIDNETINAVLSDRARTGDAFDVIAERHQIGKSSVSNIVNGKLKPRTDAEHADHEFKFVRVEDFRSKEWFLTPWLKEGNGGEISPELARFLGYYAAEGCFGHDRKGNYVDHVQFTINLNEEHTLGKDLVSVINSLFEHGVGFRLPDPRYSDRKHLVRINECNLEHHKRKMNALALVSCVTPEFKEFVCEHVGNGSWNKRLSPWVMNLNNSTLTQVLIGMFLGDGHIKKNGRFRWSSVSKELTWNVSTILNRLGIRHVITPWGKKRGLDRVTVDINCPESAKLVYGWLAPYTREFSILRTVTNKDNLNHFRKEGYLRALKGYKLSDYKGTVWDLCVEEDHSFVVHGVVCRNCHDYKFRWAWANKQRQAGKVGRNSMNGAENRAPRITNPRNTPGLCKHIIALKEYIYGNMSKMFGAGEDHGKMLSKLVKYANNKWANMPQEIERARQRDREAAAVRAARNRGHFVPFVGTVTPEPPLDPLDQTDITDDPEVPPTLPELGSELPAAQPPAKKKKQNRPGEDDSSSSHAENMVIKTRMDTTLQDSIRILQELDAGITSSETPQSTGGGTFDNEVGPDIETAPQDEPSEALDLLRQMVELLKQLVPEENGEDDSILPDETPEDKPDAGIELPSPEDDDQQPVHAPAAS